MSFRLDKITSKKVSATVKSGDTLEVQFNDTMDEVFLTGPAKIVYKGVFTID